MIEKRGSGDSAYFAPGGERRKPLANRNKTQYNGKKHRKPQCGFHPQAPVLFASNRYGICRFGGRAGRTLCVSRPAQRRAHTEKLKGEIFMKLTFLGAAHTVTGSAYLLECAGKKLIVDYGMFQGRDSKLVQPLPFPAGEVDYAVITHAHVDHTGHLPMLVKQGFRGPIFATPASMDLASILMADSAHIMKMDTEWKNKKRERRGEPPVEPLYTAEDVAATVKQFVAVEYQDIKVISPEFTVRFTDAGHILGSASVELWATEDGVTKKVVFSGDIGNLDQPILKDPQPVEEADILMVESTYGNRLHPAMHEAKEQLCRIVLETFRAGGKVIIPAFAVGRTQELLYYLRELYEAGRFAGYEHCPVFLDSPLAAEATALFSKYVDGYYDDAAMKIVRSGGDVINFKQLQLSVSSEDSKAINFYKGSCIIISASGMCDAGRIRHHLKYNLWDKRNTVVFVGYQADGTLGRRLLEGEKEVTILGDSVAVHAKIENVDGLSAHADRNGLLRWLSGFKKKPEMTFVIHGEALAATEFAAYIESERGFTSLVPELGDVTDLLAEQITLVHTQPPVEELLEETAPEPKHPEVAIISAPRYSLTNLIEALRELDQSGTKLPRKKVEALSKAVDDLLRSAH